MIMTSIVRLVCSILCFFIFVIILQLSVAIASVANITDAEKLVLLEWVNTHCEKEFDSFNALIEDRRIRCKSKVNEDVPATYYQLNGHRHVRPDPSKLLPRSWGLVFVFFFCYLFLRFIHYMVGKKTNHLQLLIRFSPFVLLGLIFLYAGTIYKDQFLKQNVDFIRKHGDGKINSFLLKACSDELFSNGESSVLYAAVDTGSLEMVKYLVEEMKYNPNQQYMNVLPIALAANHAMTDIVDYLMIFFPDNRKKGGRLFFKTAILLSHIEYVKEMLEDDYIKKQINYQSPGAPWISRRSALYLAVNRNDVEMALLLLQNGADPTLQNYYDNKTPIDAAKHNNNIEMQRLLNEYLREDNK
jgi:hypothetical protein